MKKCCMWQHPREHVLVMTSLLTAQSHKGNFAKLDAGKMKTMSGSSGADASFHR